MQLLGGQFFLTFFGLRTCNQKRKQSWRDFKHFKMNGRFFVYGNFTPFSCRTEWKYFNIQGLIFIVSTKYKRFMNTKEELWPEKCNDIALHLFYIPLVYCLLVLIKYLQKDHYIFQSQQQELLNSYTGSKLKYVLK